MSLQPPQQTPSDTDIGEGRQMAARKKDDREPRMRRSPSTTLICAWIAIANIDKTMVENEGKQIPIVLDDDYTKPFLFSCTKNKGCTQLKLLNYTLCGHSECGIEKPLKDICEAICKMKKGDDKIQSLGSTKENIAFRVRLEGRFSAALASEAFLLSRSQASDIGRKQYLLFQTLGDACQQEVQNDDKMAQDLANFLDKWGPMGNCVKV